MLAVGWAWLFVDAWRLGHPLALRQKQRLAMVGLNGVLCFSVAGTLLFASHVVARAAGLHQRHVRRRHRRPAPTHGRYNVLLLGGDSGADRWGLRPDSMTVASIDADTGKTVLFGLPRNMTNFPFPEGSIMARAVPARLRLRRPCELNGLSTWAGDHKTLFKGVRQPRRRGDRSRASRGSPG